MLLEKPRRIEVVMLQPEGPVVSLRIGGDVRRVASVIGPERIARRWWLGGVLREEVGAPLPADPSEPVEAEMPDAEFEWDYAGVAGGVARNYFKVQDGDGRWWWVFRELRSGRWYVQGWW